MKYKKELYRLFLFIFLSTLFISFLNVIETNESVESSDNLKLNNNHSNRSIILMIGDGMGHEHIKLASLVELGDNDSFSFQILDNKCNVSTHNVNNAITDSAAAATALATGKKTNNGMLSVLPNNAVIETILEYAQSLGKSTGIVSTTSITHATPAAFMAHVNSRYLTIEIARQIVEESGVDVMLGGGRSFFSESQIAELEINGYAYAEIPTDLMNNNSSSMIGLFANDDLPYEANRIPSITPSLYNMTKKAIELLSTNPNGFFLMVEGGKIDHAAHDNNKVNVALETIEFNLAIDCVLDFCLTNNDTLLIVTADHETGGLNVLDNILNDNLPAALDSYEEKKTLRIQRANNISVSWSSTSHTDNKVPMYVFNPISDKLNFEAIIDNTQIFVIMKSFFNPNYNPISIGGNQIVIFGMIFVAVAVIIKKTRSKESFIKN